MSVSAVSGTDQRQDLILKRKGASAFQQALIVGKDSLSRIADADAVLKPVWMAIAIEDMKEALTPEAMSIISHLSDSSLGFKTDKKPGEKYDPETLKRIVIQAVLNGVNIVGNEFNIIKGEMFIAKNGWKRKLKEAGFSRIDVNVGRPEDVKESSRGNGGASKISAMFCASATCQKDGETFQVTATLSQLGDYRIEVDGFASSLMDVQTQLRGKAEARILRKLWFYVCDEPEPDTDEPEGSVIVVEHEQPARIDAAPQPPADPWAAEWKRFPEEHPARKLARKMREAKPDAIDACMIEADSLLGDAAIDKRAHDTLRRYFEHLKAGAA